MLRVLYKWARCAIWPDLRTFKNLEIIVKSRFCALLSPLMETRTALVRKVVVEIFGGGQKEEEKCGKMLHEIFSFG